MTTAPPGINTDWSQYPGPQAYLTWQDRTGTTNWLTFDVVDSEKWEEGAEVTEHPVEVGANVGDHVRVKLVTCELKVFVSQEPIDASPYIGTSRSLAAPTLTPMTLPTPSWVPQGGIIIVPEWNSNIDQRAYAGALVGLVGGLSGAVGELAGVAGTAAAAALLPGYTTDIPVATDAGLLPPGPSAPVYPVVQQFTEAQDFVLAMHAQLVALKDAAQLITVVGTKRVLANMVIESLAFSRDVDTGTGEDVSIGLKHIRIVRTQQVAAPIPNLPAGGGKPPANHGAQTPTPVPTSAAKAIILGYAASHPTAPTL